MDWLSNTPRGCLLTMMLSLALSHSIVDDKAWFDAAFDASLLLPLLIRGFLVEPSL